MSNDGHLELEKIKKWIDHLSNEEFVQAITIQFRKDLPTDGASSSQNDKPLNSSGSHEFNLLREMLESQSPPPTPIHPRALWFQSASEAGFRDGRRDEESRVQRNRFMCPRLFQFVERFSEDEVERNLDLTQLPPEIAAIVKQENVIKNVTRRESRRRKWGKKMPNNETPKLFDVLAKKFVTAWGDILTVGCTEVQRQADEAILKCSYIQYGCRGSNKSISSNTVGPICTFKLVMNKNKEASKVKGDVLNIMRIASRGKFLSTPPCRAKVSVDLTFCAPWFDPRSEWFSLPMYLASRFEAALWDSYLCKEKSIKEFIPQTRIEEAYMNLPEHFFLRCLFSSVCRSLKESIFSDVATSGRNRDLILNQLLNSRSCSLTQIFDSVITNRDCDISSITSTNLIKLGTTSDKFRLVVIKHLENAISIETERELLNILQAEKNCTTNEFKSKKFSKKSKKKKKRKKVSKSSKLSAIDEVKTAAVLTQCKKVIPPLPSTLSSPISLTNYPSNESNQKNIMALAIFDEIVNDVCDKLGISSVKDSDDDWVDYDNTNKGNTNVMKRLESKALPSKGTQTDYNDKVQQDTSAIKQSVENESSELWDSNNEHAVNQLTMKTNNLTRMPGPTTWHETSSDSLGPSTFDVLSSLKFGEPFSDMYKWGHQESLNLYQGRESRILSDIFIHQKQNFETDDDFASSNAASIASSVLDSDDDLDQIPALIDSKKDSVVEAQPNQKYVSIVDDERRQNEDSKVDFESNVENETKAIHKEDSPPMVSSGSSSTRLEVADEEFTTTVPLLEKSTPIEDKSIKVEKINTPLIQPSPIVVSPSDIKELQKHKSVAVPSTNTMCEESSKNSISPVYVTGSLPSSPKAAQQSILTNSWSREDLGISSQKDDQIGRGKVRSVASCTVDSSLSYRNAAMKNVNVRKPPSVSSHEICKLKNVGKPPSVSSYDAFELSTMQKKLAESARFVRSASNSKEVIIDGYIHLNTCAQSESALDAHEDSSHWNVVPKTGFYGTDNATKDGATTISSFQPEIEEFSCIREERNAFRDMCLTLGGQITKLQNIIAMDRGASMCLNTTHAESYVNYAVPLFQGSKFAALSDIGLHHEVQPSEDGTDGMQGSISATDASGKPRSNIGGASNMRLSPMVESRTGSDVPSIKHRTVTYSTLNISSRLNHREYVGPKDLHDLQSRLTKDINSFLSSVASRLKEQDSVREMVIKRLRSLVNTIWPRAQVKKYGSHETNLCLPSSDFDVVVCLPAVHKNTLADTPGALEGRNAVNESNQKLLARKLKCESWIDQRSMKVIERTAFPLIKVSTKGKNVRPLQLDISFDSPLHHGVEAVTMVNNTIESYPLVRPLVLVLKKFLLGKGLLTSYTGGVSSYCLFLMVTRYLQVADDQKQIASPWVDSGSLLMGFLDFYGNAFENRSTGISVLKRQYFSRHTYDSQEHQIFSLSPNIPSGPNFSTSLYRRHSFQEVPYTINNGCHQPTKTPLSCQPKHPHFVSRHASPSAHSKQDIPGRPTHYDPLFVEDPLNPANNVGRNCFRFLQVKRAFSDAHRALVASLEWDMNSAVDLHDSAYYPLLKCVLQSESMSWDL